MRPSLEPLEYGPQFKPTSAPVSITEYITRFRAFDSTRWLAAALRVLNRTLTCLMKLAKRQRIKSKTITLECHEDFQGLTRKQAHRHIVLVNRRELSFAIESQEQSTVFQRAFLRLFFPGRRFWRISERLTRRYGGKRQLETNESLTEYLICCLEIDMRVSQNH